MALTRKTPLIAISMGDPAGIGPEVILKAAGLVATHRAAPSLVVIGDFTLMKETACRLGRDVPELIQWCPAKSVPKSAPRLSEGLAVIDTGILKESSVKPGHPTVQCGDAAYRYVLEGARMAMRGEVDALVTAPINKEWMNRAGHRFPGHSELLARLSRTRLWRMMFVGEHLRLALATVHIGLAKVSSVLTRDLVYRTITLLAAHMRDQLGFDNPRIAVLGFNPHAGENGLFGDEELKIIAPAIRRAARGGVDAYGPLAPDTAFIRTGGRFGFDAAVAMYHDQGLIALKTLEFDRAVNVTLGLPFVRTSPDHGTAYEIAGKSVANPASMAAAIEYATKAARARLLCARRAA